MTVSSNVCPADGSLARASKFRIITAVDGVHIYNRDGHHIAKGAFSLFPTSTSRPMADTPSISAPN